MNGIIIDGTTAVQFKGQLKKFGEALEQLSKLETKIDGLKVNTVPLPEVAGIAILLNFSGPIMKFEKMTNELQAIKRKYQIETVPLPEFKTATKSKASQKRPKGLCWFIKIE
jgi:hypothetical protein